RGDSRMNVDNPRSQQLDDPLGAPQLVEMYKAFIFPASGRGSARPVCEKTLTNKEATERLLEYLQDCPPGTMCLTRRYCGFDSTGMADISHDFFYRWEARQLHFVRHRQRTRLVDVSWWSAILIAMFLTIPPLFPVLLSWLVR